jgi:voltage-gated potassium channel
MQYSYDPFNKENRATLLWQIVLFCAICYCAIEAPLSFVLQSRIEEHNLWWDGILSLIFFADVYFKVTNKLKLPITHKWDVEDDNPRKYQGSPLFFFDIFLSLPFDLIAFTLGLGLPYKLILSFRLIRVLRIAKLKSIFDMFDHLPRIMKVGTIITGIFCGLHWIACGWMHMNPNPQLDTLSSYNLSLYWAVSTLTTVGYGDITPNSNITRLYTMAVMLIGVASYGIIIGNFSRMIMLADKYKELKKEKFGALFQFMKFYNVPSSLQKQVYSYYKHMFAHNISDEDQNFVKELPEVLRQELQLFMKIKLIRNVHIFGDCSTPCLKMIAEKLQEKFYGPNEYIIKKGTAGEEMFIIGHGEVEVSNGETVQTTLKTGQFFGEISLLEDRKRGADIITKSYCDMHVLSKKDFLEVISKYPDLSDKFQMTVKKRSTDNRENLKAA